MTRKVPVSGCRPHTIMVLFLLIIEINGKLIEISMSPFTSIKCKQLDQMDLFLTTPKRKNVGSKLSR